MISSLVSEVLSVSTACLQGVRNLRKTDLDPLYIFIKPPSMEELVRHCGHRLFTHLLLTISVLEPLALPADLTLPNTRD